MKKAGAQRSPSPVKAEYTAMMHQSAIFRRRPLLQIAQSAKNP
jgi:hypothetical protein